jgi:hypothetical protein
LATSLIRFQIYFGISTPFSSLSLFTPTITAGLGYSGLQAQLMTVPPYAVSYVVTILVSWSADHFNARALHSATFATIGALGFLASAVLPPHAYASRYGCLIVAASGSFIVGVWIYKANEKADGYPTGHWTNCALLFFVAAGCLALLVYYRMLNAGVRKRGETRFYKY